MSAQYFKVNELQQQFGTIPQYYVLQTAFGNGRVPIAYYTLSKVIRERYYNCGVKVDFLELARYLVDDGHWQQFQGRVQAAYDVYLRQLHNLWVAYDTDVNAAFARFNGGQMTLSEWYAERDRLQTIYKTYYDRWDDFMDEVCRAIVDVKLSTGAMSMNDINIHLAYPVGPDGTANVNGVYVSIELALNNNMTLVQDPSTGRAHSRQYLYVAPGVLPSKGTLN